MSFICSFVGDGFVVTWTATDDEGYSLGIFAQRFDAGGVPIGDQIEVVRSDGEDRNPKVAPTADGVVPFERVAVGIDAAMAGGAARMGRRRTTGRRRKMKKTKKN